MAREFSFRKDGPYVEELYGEGKTVTQIAKELGRGYATIKNYLEYKGLYEGPASSTGGMKTKSGKAPDEHRLWPSWSILDNLQQ